MCSELRTWTLAWLPISSATVLLSDPKQLQTSVKRPVAVSSAVRLWTLLAQASGISLHRHFRHGMYIDLVTQMRDIALGMELCGGESEWTKLIHPWM